MKNIIDQDWSSYIPHNSKGYPDRQCWSIHYQKVFINGHEMLECRTCVYDYLKAHGRIGPK